jgi:hypothetical protein
MKAAMMKVYNDRSFFPRQRKGALKMRLCGMISPVCKEDIETYKAAKEHEKTQREIRRSQKKAEAEGRVSPDQKGPIDENLHELQIEL